MTNKVGNKFGQLMDVDYWQLLLVGRLTSVLLQAVSHQRIYRSLIFSLEGDGV
jgi:hypothetical protein